MHRQLEADNLEIFAEAIRNRFYGVDEKLFQIYRHSAPR